MYILKVEGTFNYGQNCYSFPKDVGRGEPFGFQLCSRAILLLFSYHLLIQVCKCPWISLRRSFRYGLSLHLILPLLNMT
jgi:hypothetical protein